MRISRRGFVLGLATVNGCRRKRGSGFEGSAFVVNEESRTLVAVDLTAFSVRRHLTLDARPRAVVAHPDHSVVYVLTPQTGTVHEIDAETLAPRRKLKVAAQADAMRLDPGGRWLWLLSRESRALVRVDAGRFEISARVRLPYPPDGFDLSPREPRAAVTFAAEATAALIDTGAARIERVVAAGADARAVRFRADGRQVLIGNRAPRLLSILDTASGRLVVRLPLAVEPERFCFKDDGGVLYLSGTGMDAVVVVYPYQSMVAETVLAGKSPGAMAVTSAAPEILLVANPSSGDVTILDIETSRMIAVVHTGVEPGFIAVTPDQQYALVLNHASGDMAVIRIAALRDKRNRPAPSPLFTMIPVGSRPLSAVVRAS